MANEDRQISLAGKVLVDRIDAELLEVQKQGQVVGFGVALTMGRPVSPPQRTLHHNISALQRGHRSADQ
jgi:hypothetical protein